MEWGVLFDAVLRPPPAAARDRVESGGVESTEYTVRSTDCEWFRREEKSRAVTPGAPSPQVSSLRTHYGFDTALARRYSRLRRAMFETEMAAGQAASHS